VVAQGCVTQDQTDQVVDEGADGPCRQPAWSRVTVPPLQRPRGLERRLVVIVGTIG
jgi:hypothetical protein